MLISRVAKEYGLSPSAARRELETDPEHLALLIMDLRAYEAAKQAFDRARDKATGLQEWDGSPHMTLVETHTFELRQARLFEGRDG
jgi:hypothetical protein